MSGVSLDTHLTHKNTKTLHCKCEMAWEMENSNTGRNGCFPSGGKRRRLQAERRKGQGKHDKVIKIRTECQPTLLSIHILTIKNS